MVKVRFKYKDGHYEIREMDPSKIIDLVFEDLDIINWDILSHG